MGDGAQAAQHRGGVDQNVQLAMPLEERQPQLVDAAAVSEIHGRQGRATPTQTEYLVIQFLERSLGAANSDDLRAGAGKGQGGGPADPPAGAGDQGDTSDQRFDGRSHHAACSWTAHQSVDASSIGSYSPANPLTPPTLAPMTGR